jgi:putative transposase
MGKKHFTEEQIAFALRQAESGTPVAELIRRLGVSEQTFYRWKKEFAGLGVAELRRLQTFEEENRKLRQLGVEPSFIPDFVHFYSAACRDRIFGPVRAEFMVPAAAAERAAWRSR